MHKFSKFAVATAALVFLNGCLEVEDNSNDDVADALEEQNDAIEANKTPITLFGAIVDANTKQVVSDATVTLKVGSEWRAPVTVSGEFSIEKLPVNTDIIALVKSPSGEFMDRAFYGKTMTVESGQFGSQSMGDLSVSEPIEKSFSVLDSDSSASFEGLTFSYNTVGVFSSNYRFSGVNDYKVESTYNESTSLYSVTLPKDLYFELTASGDLDGDGIVDVTAENSYFQSSDGISLSADEAMQLQVMYVNETAAYQPVELRISAIDSLGDTIEGIVMTASDRYQGRFETSYDEATSEYVFNYQTSSRVDLMMPSFTTSEGISYQSAQINLIWASENSLSINDYGFLNNLPNTIDVLNGVASIVVQPRVTSTNNNVSRVSSEINTNDNFSLNEFYESSIGLVEDSFSLSRLDVFKVIKGNDSDSDLVPFGTTQIGKISESVETTGSLSHNNTFLTVIPNTALSSGDYRYHVEQLINAQTGELFSTNHSKQFEVESTSNEIPDFNINDIKLDNNNGTTNGNLIVAQNTAGDANTDTNNNRAAYLYFPPSIQKLEFLELNMVSYIYNGSLRTQTRQITVVSNGNLQANQRYLVSLAENESTQTISGGYSVSFEKYASLADGVWYYIHGGQYFSDNTAGNVNSATYNYIYRVKGDATVYEGSITLPVL